MLNSEQAADYFIHADRRIMIGLRATLEILGIPRPDYAERRPPGRPSAKIVAAAYAKDHGKTAKELHVDRAIAANKAKAAQAASLAEARGLPGNIFAQSFGR